MVRAVDESSGKLTIVIVAGFGEGCILVREGKMFVKDEAKTKLFVAVVPKNEIK